MILINGNFLCRNLTGIERFAWEVCNRLDPLVLSDEEVALLLPKNATTIPSWKHIKIIKSDNEIKGFPFWDLGVFARTANQMKAIPLNFSNTAPLQNPCGIAFLHDIYAAECPQDFTSFRDRLVRLYSLMHYNNIAKHAGKVITVSHYSKKEIQKHYGTPDEKIRVIPNGWEHFKDIEADLSIFQRFPVLKEKPFYFTLGSLSKRKNLAWIARHAQLYPQEIFAVSGKAISGLVPPDLQALQKLDNVILLGYVSDQEVKALMQSCKAFIFPSYYEGFGIPPLEALSCGATCIVSRSASLPEIYGDAVHYIDPTDPSCDLEELLNRPLTDYHPLLEKFSYQKAAEDLYSVIKEINPKNREQA